MGLLFRLKFKAKKADIWVSAVLYLLVISVVLVIVLEAGTPILNKLRDKSIFDQTKNNFISLDKHIGDISAAGPGSQRVVPLEIKKGTLSVENGNLKWEMDTNAYVLQPRTSIQLGNLRIGSDADVSAYEYNNTYVLENYYIKAVFSKIGNETNYGKINSTSILRHIEDNRGTSTTGTFSFFIDDEAIESDGYTKLMQTGHNLGSATLLVYMNMSGGTAHTLLFTLDAKADFLKVNLI